MLTRLLAVLTVPLLFACTVVDDDYEITERSGGKPCLSDDDCPSHMGCNDDCNPAPGCQSGRPCAAVCYGSCEPVEACGSVVCPAGTVCCNESCGICTEPEGVCTQQICEDTEEL